MTLSATARVAAGLAMAVSAGDAQVRLANDSVVQAIVRQRVDEGRSAGIAIGHVRVRVLVGQTAKSD